jgi:3-hydroxyacyl-[acyl-carrier-protein] dehydratase
MSEATADAGDSRMDIHQILDYLPHRYPILLVDRVLDVVPGERIRALKNVSVNEPYFPGHYPHHPVMPGVLIVEAMAQTAGVLVVHTLGPESEGKLVYFMTIDEARFRRPVTPGDQLRIHVTKERSRGSVWKFVGEAKVDGVRVAEATFSAMIVDR